MANESPKKKDRRDLLLLLLIVLIAFACMLTVGTLATRLAPQWMLQANMNSGINPDDLYTPQIGYIAPINEDILTQRFDDSYLTPGTQTPTTESSPNVTPTEIFRTNVPSPTTASTLVPTATSIFTPSPTATTLQTPSPTSPAPPAPTATSVPSADLRITKSDSSSTYIPGNSISYQVVVRNAGPDNASGFRVVDNVPAAITGLTVTCAPSGSASCGNNNTSGNSVRYDNAAVSAGASNWLTFTISGTVAPGTTGNLANTASIVIPGGAGFSDPNSSNNSATDTDTPAIPPSTDLSIVKDDGVTTYTPGGSVTYSIQVSNAGPSDVTGGTVSDTFPALITSISWTCAASGGGSCTPNGSGNINDTINLPAGESLTYTAVANINGSATGPLTNTASVAPPAGVTDPNGSNNSATDTDTPASSLSADLSITKVADIWFYASGYQMIYTIRVSNSGPSNVSGATISDAFPAEVSNPSPAWTCTATGGASCTPSGNGNINDTIDLPVGGLVTYTVTVITSASSGDIVNTAVVNPPAGISDPNTGNNSATETTPPIPSCIRMISPGPVSVPDGDCILILTSSGTYGNLYTITNTDTSSLNILWTGLDENQTSGFCTKWNKTLGAGNVLNQIAVRLNVGTANLITRNFSGGPITISITRNNWLTGGCSN